MSVTLIYCNYLADPKKKPFINITAGDRVFRIKNEIGATIEVPLEAQARSIIAAHRIVVKEGEFAAFTDNRPLFERMLRAQRNDSVALEIAPPRKRTKQEILEELQALEEAEGALS